MQKSSENVLIFIKGTAANPFCKFTKELINILKENKIKFDFVNILE